MPRPLIVLASAFAAIIVLAAVLFTWTDMQERQVASGDPLQIVPAAPEPSAPATPATSVQPADSASDAAQSAAADANVGNTSAEPEAETADQVPTGVAETVGAAAGSKTPASSATPAEATTAATDAEEGEVVAAVELGFDIVRVEPTGEALFAGQAAPGAKIEIVDGEAVIASTTADAEGAFVAIPEAPLAPGEHAIAVRVDGSTAPADAQSQVAVTVPEIGGGAATIITGEEQVAAADLETTTPEPRPLADAAASAADVSEGAATESETARGAAAGSSGGFSERPAATAQGSPSAAEQDTADTAEQEIALGGTAAGEAPDRSGTTQPSGQTPATASDVASETAPMAANETAPMGANEASTVADGAAAPTSTAPDAGAGTATTAEAAAPGAAGTNAPAEIAADPTAETPPSKTEVAAIGGDGSNTGPDAPAAEAAMEPGAPADGANANAGTNTAAGTLETATAESDPAANMAAVEPILAIKAAEAEARQLYVAGEAAPGTLVRVYANDDLVGEARTNSNGAWLVEASKELAVGEVVIRADAVASRPETPSAQVELPFVRYGDGVVLEPAANVAGAPAAAATSELQPPSYVLIRRGDNLWRISRRNYGRGIRFKTIFAANRDLIRNPHRIFPGQLFVLPKRDTSWETAIN